MHIDYQGRKQDRLDWFIRASADTYGTLDYKIMVRTGSERR